MPEKYNKLEVLEKRIATSDKGKTYTEALCKCDCGNIKWTRYSPVKTGKIKSCGCFHKEKAKNTCIERNYKHGCCEKGKRHLAQVYYSMIRRCEDETCSSYKNYGEREIKVCEEWKKDISQFVRWAENNGGNDKTLQLDRIDNSKGYSPDNCRFITCSENLRNRRNTVMINGKVAKDYFIELSDESGISWKTIHSRYYKLLKYGIPITKENLLNSIDHRKYELDHANQLPLHVEKRERFND